MKKTLALLALTAALAAPMAAQAHRAWLAPTSTVLSGNDAWVGFDAGMSNVVFQPDHAAMRLSGLEIIAPDGSRIEARNSAQGRYRSMFDIELKQEGTYRVANVVEGFMATYEQGGERKRFRGSEAEFATGIPADATNVQPVRTFTRTETFVTLGNPNETALAATGKGLELVPVSHPNDAAEGEASSFKLLLNGQPAADVEVTIAREGLRYRSNPEEITAKTAADGTFTVTWAASGLHWIGASVRTPGANGQPGTNASYNGTIEVLP
ncbi:MULTISPECIES: DUF4198 domain-containing protein [unclassified Brevundimonas]|uniref:DUF4198 domain-containing protein n=1 Tax=unclassified Brevundimonas TaxID=2622653 RepID=UPI0025C02B9D|nr:MULTISPECIES: DUF4198 domain-containing protein [unclassified Brevundimonas]